MQKFLSVLAALSLCTSIAQAAGSIMISGSVDTSAAYENKVFNADKQSTGAKTSLKAGNLIGSTINIDGHEDLSELLKALFHIEINFNSTNGSFTDHDLVDLRKPAMSKVFVGLSSDRSGTITLGRQTDFADTLGSMTSGTDFGGLTGAIGKDLDRLGGTKTTNSISYTTIDWHGFTGNALYGFGNMTSLSDGQAFGIGGQYRNGPFGLGLNYYQSKAASDFIHASDTFLVFLDRQPNTALNPHGGAIALKVFNLVGSYEIGPTRIYANWSRVKQPLNTGPATTLGKSSKADMFELGTAYSMNPSLKLLAAIDHTRADLPGTDNKGHLTQISLGADYGFSKRTGLYAFVANLRASNMDNPGVYYNPPGGFVDVNGAKQKIGNPQASQTVVTLGMRHKF